MGEYVGLSKVYFGRTVRPGGGRPRAEQRLGEVAHEGSAGARTQGKNKQFTSERAKVGERRQPASSRSLPGSRVDDFDFPQQRRQHSKKQDYSTLIIAGAGFWRRAIGCLLPFPICKLRKFGFSGHSLAASHVRGLPVPAKRDERYSGHGAYWRWFGRCLGISRRDSGQDSGQDSGHFQQQQRPPHRGRASEAAGRAARYWILPLSMDGVCALGLPRIPPAPARAAVSSLWERPTVFCLMDDRARALPKGHRRLRRRAVHSGAVQRERAPSLRLRFCRYVARPGLRWDGLLRFSCESGKVKSEVETFPHDAATEFRRIVVRKSTSTL
jgi:hypothetical protein